MRRWSGLLVLLGALPVSAEPWEATVSLEAARSEIVYVYLAGVVRDVTVEVGDRVRAGDTLAWLEDEALQLQAESVRLAHQQAQRWLMRVRVLHPQGGLSTVELEELEMKAVTAHLRYQQVQLDLARTVLIASMGGILAACHIHPGLATSPRMAAFHIIDPEDLQAELFVPADQLEGIRKGHAVTARAQQLKQPLAGRLILVSPIVDPASGTCRALARFPQAGQLLRPGSVVRVQVDRTRIK